ncbi:MAG: hypothetical protein AAF541_22800 [Pseudomonadota bacterium]
MEESYEEVPVDVFIEDIKKELKNMGLDYVEASTEITDDSYVLCLKCKQEPVEIILKQNNKSLPLGQNCLISMTE